MKVSNPAGQNPSLDIMGFLKRYYEGNSISKNDYECFKVRDLTKKVGMRFLKILSFLMSNPIYKNTKVCPVSPFFSETAPPILMKLGIHFIHRLKMVLK